MFKQFFSKLWERIFSGTTSSADQLSHHASLFNYKLMSVTRDLGEERIITSLYQMSQVIELLQPSLYKQPLRILDFGCQDGLTDFILKQYAPHATIIGTDISPWAIEYAQQTFNTISFVRCSPKNLLPFDAESFDIVYSIQVFHHIDPLQHRWYVEELLRLIKPGGLLLILELNPLNHAVHNAFGQDPDEQHATMVNPWQLRALAETYGSTDLKFFNFFPRLQELRFLEPYLTKIPYGHYYSCMVKKN